MHDERIRGWKSRKTEGRNDDERTGRKDGRRKIGRVNGREDVKAER
jgi:hypothetical protein